MFLSYVSGGMGRELVGAYMNLLVEFPCLGQPEFANSFFELVLQQVAEAWRRFSLEQNRFCNRLFALTSLDHASFLAEFRKLQALEKVCPHCVDLEFSAVLLRWLPEMCGADTDVTDESPLMKEKVKQLKQYLQDLTVYSPLSADVVECLHGACQSRLGRFRGPRLSDPVAQQVTVLDKICSSYCKFREWMWSHYGDRRALNRLHAYGQHKGNQYGRGSQKPAAKMTLEHLDLDGLIDSKLPRPRKICGHLAIWLVRQARRLIIVT